AVTLPAALVPPPPIAGDPVRVQVRVKNPMLTAGVVLTCVGTVISVVGSAIFFATWNPSPAQTDLHNAGGITALAAEPLMWAGPILWPLGIQRPPHEARP